MVEISVKLVTKLMTKLLINAKDYDFSDVFFMASTLLNNSWHPAIKAVLSTLLYGHKTFDYGPLGTAQPAPRVTTRLLQHGFEKEIKELKKLIDWRVSAAKYAMQEARDKMQRAYNKGKIEDPPWPSVLRRQVALLSKLLLTRRTWVRIPLDPHID
jgi:hypothetical protein